MALSFVFVKDLAEAIVACLTHPAAAGKTFYIASPEVTTARALAGGNRLADENVDAAAAAAD